LPPFEYSSFQGKGDIYDLTYLEVSSATHYQNKYDECAIQSNQLNTASNSTYQARSPVEQAAPAEVSLESYAPMRPEVGFFPIQLAELELQGQRWYLSNSIEPDQTSTATRSITLDHDQIAYFSRYCAQLDLLEWVYFQSCDEASLQSGAWRVPRDVAGEKVQSLGLTQLHEYLHHLTLQNIHLFYLLICFYPQAPVALGGGKEKCLAFRRRGKWQGF
jgi:hypothetical protein